MKLYLCLALLTLSSALVSRAVIGDVVIHWPDAVPAGLTCVAEYGGTDQKTWVEIAASTTSPITVKVDVALGVLNHFRLRYRNLPPSPPVSTAPGAVFSAIPTLVINAKSPDGQADIRVIFETTVPAGGGLEARTK